MTRWQIPFSLCIALAFGAATLLTGCPEDPAEAMLKARGGGTPSAPPPDTSTPGTPPAGGAPATPGNTAGGAPAVPPPGAPGTPPGGKAPTRGLPGATPPGAAEAKPKPSGPKVTINVKSIKAPYPRYSGKGRYDVTVDVSVDPPQDEGVWKVSALDSSGKVVGTREEQLVLLREKPRTIIFDSFYCLAAPTSFKMEIALDKDGKPKKATNAGGGVDANGNGKSGPGGMGNVGGAGGAGGAGGGGASGGGNSGGGDSGGGGSTPPPQGGGPGGGGDSGG